MSPLPYWQRGSPQGLMLPPRSIWLVGDDPANTSTTWNDSSGNGRMATSYSSGGTQYTLTTRGGHGCFTGGAGGFAYLSIPSFALAQSVSAYCVYERAAADTGKFECFVGVNGTGYGLATGGYNGYGGVASSGPVQGTIDSDALRYAATAGSNVTGIHCAFLTYDGTTCTVYHDGIFVVSAALAAWTLGTNWGRIYGNNGVAHYPNTLNGWMYEQGEFNGYCMSAALVAKESARALGVY